MSSLSIIMNIGTIVASIVAIYFSFKAMGYSNKTISIIKRRR